MDFPTIQITAQFPGAPAGNDGDRRLHRRSSASCPTISGITSMDSSSSLGLAQITIQFDLTAAISHGAALDVQTALATSARLLPDRNDDNLPSFRARVNPGDFPPVLYVSLRSGHGAAAGNDGSTTTPKRPFWRRSFRNRRASRRCWSGGAVARFCVLRLSRILAQGGRPQYRA